MERSTQLVVLCVSLFLVVFPLTLVKPGWPAGLKSDEPAYYLMALSLAHDQDLELDLGDVRRLFGEFPYHQVHNLILATDDGWHTVYYGKPYVYSLAAAPMARLFGASGMVAFNMMLLVGMAWLGTRWLARTNPGWSAALFSFGFFFLSCGFSYVFWLHPEIFNMAAVTACCYLALAEPTRVSRAGKLRQLIATPWVRWLVSGLVLAPGIYNKPMLLAFALPAVVVAWQRARLRGPLVWIGGLALGMALVLGGSMALTGHPSAYLMARGGQKLCSPDAMPIGPAPAPLAAVAEAPAEPAPVPEAEVAIAAGETAVETTGGVDAGASTASEPSAEEAPRRPRASWFWLARIPKPHPREVTENLGYFFWGRHTGLLLYFPFAGLSVLLFLLHRRRDLVGWAMVAALASVALFFLLWIPFNWQGGGGFVGNRYFVNAYPGFLFLVGRIAPRAIHWVGFLLGGLLLGPTVFSPWGRAVPSPTLQAHVRNAPFGLFPLELSLREIPGYEQRIWSGALVRGRSDLFLPRGARFWTHGATTTEVWIQSEERMSSLVFELGSLAGTNRVRLKLEGAEVERTFSGISAEGNTPPNRERIELPAPRPTRVRQTQNGPVYVYVLEVTASHGAVRTWERRFPPQDCFTFAYNDVIVESFFVGAEVSFLGSGEHLAKDLYAIEWGQVRGPERVTAGERFTVGTQVRNASDVAWPATPPTRVALSYRWTTADGSVVVENGLRTHPERPVAPSEMLVAHQEVLAPDAPGDYVLELDLVYEMVAWFSWRNGETVKRLPVTVVADPSNIGGDADPSLDV